MRRLAQVAQNAQEEPDRQRVLAFDKNQVIQSITEVSQSAHARLKYLEDEVERLNAELQCEHDIRLPETKQLSDEQVGVQDRHLMPVTNRRRACSVRRGNLTLNLTDTGTAHCFGLYSNKNLELTISVNVAVHTEIYRALFHT
jgi:uncharacterized small protein (DUF1192 family)